MNYRARIDTYERSLICDALTRHNGNQSQAARTLDMPRATLVDRIAALGIDATPSTPLATSFLVVTRSGVSIGPLDDVLALMPEGELHSFLSAGTVRLEVSA